jgi:hypothetical protein
MTKSILSLLIMLHTVTVRLSLHWLGGELTELLLLRFRLHHPIVVSVTLYLLPVCYRPQLIAQKLIVRLVLEMQATNIQQHLLYLMGETSAQQVHRCSQLLLSYSLVLLLLVCGF